MAVNSEIEKDRLSLLAYLPSQNCYELIWAKTRIGDFNGKVYRIAKPDT